LPQTRLKLLISVTFQFQLLTAIPLMMAGNAFFQNISADEGYIIFNLSPLLTNRGEGIKLLEKSKSEIKNAKKTRLLQNSNRWKNVVKKSSHKRMSSQEFLEIYKNLWKEGPKVKYQNPEGWIENRQSFEG
jgi:hypothetical protein